jgi:hypothetical protein
MSIAKLAAAALTGVVAGVVLEHPIRDGYNWVRGKLGLPALPSVSGQEVKDFIRKRVPHADRRSLN